MSGGRREGGGGVEESGRREKGEVGSDPRGETEEARGEKAAYRGEVKKTEVKKTAESGIVGLVGGKGNSEKGDRVDRREEAAQSEEPK